MPFRELTGVHDCVGLGLDVTIRCNWNCPACFAHLDGQEMSWEIYQKCVDQARSLGFEELYILGGEPTLRKDILRLLEYARGLFRQVILVTNGQRLANRAFCRQVAETDVTLAMQRHTLDSDARAETVQDTMVGRKGTLSDVNQAWANVLDFFAPERICVQCCIMQPVIRDGDIFKVFRWARENGLEPVMEFAKEGRHFHRGCALDVPSAGVLKILRGFQEIDRELCPDSAASILTPQAYGKTCHMVETSVHCKVNGSVIPCVGHQNLVLGNILENPLAEILQHPLRRAIQEPQEWIWGYCVDSCPHFEQCTGGCRGSAYDQSGCYRASMYYCPHIPHNLLQIADMIPPSCTDCPLATSAICAPKREA